MNKKNGFYDLRISGNQGLDKINQTCEVLVKLGYRTVAIDLVLEESVFGLNDSAKGKPKKFKKETLPSEPQCLVPPPSNIGLLAKNFKNKLTILHRLTVHFSEAEQLYRLSKEANLSRFDLLALAPRTEAAFQAACSSPEADVVTFDPAEPMGRNSRKHYYLAVERGVCFELMYAPAIGDRQTRRNIIHQAHQYHAFGKSRNIVLTSNANCASDVRGPYDVINLALLFGLSEEQSKAALTYTCRKLLIDAEARRTGRAAVLVKRSDPKRRPSWSDEDSQQLGKMPRVQSQ